MSPRHETPRQQDTAKVSCHAEYQAGAGYSAITDTDAAQAARRISTHLRLEQLPAARRLTHRGKSQEPNGITPRPGDRCEPACTLAHKTLGRGPGGAAEGNRERQEQQAERAGWEQVPGWRQTRAEGPPEGRKNTNRGGNSTVCVPACGCRRVGMCMYVFLGVCVMCMCGMCVMNAHTWCVSVYACAPVSAHTRPALPTMCPVLHKAEMPLR